MNNLTKFDAKKITLKHLRQKYTESEAEALMKEHHDDLFKPHGLAYDLCRGSLHYFCELCLHSLLFDYDAGLVPLSNTHYEIWDELEDNILHHNNTKNCYIFPRGFGKTTAITTPVTMWATLCGHVQYAIITSAVESTASNFIDIIKSQLEDNIWLKQIFGEVVNKNLIYNSSVIELDTYPKRVKIESASANSSLRGKNFLGLRPQLVMMDDYQDEKQITSEQGRESAVQKLNNVVLKMTQTNNNHFIACGTIQRKNDIYDTLLKSPIWETRTERCVLIDDVDDYFRNNPYWVECGKILKRHRAGAKLDAEDYYLDHQADMDFPTIWEKYDCFDLFQSWLSDPVSFKQEYQCDINNLGEKRIKSISAISENEIESLEYVNTVLSVDPAATTGTKSDYSAFCVLSKADNNIKYCRKAIIKKLDFDNYINTIIDLLNKYTDISTLSVEKQTYMGADIIKIREMIEASPTLRGRTITIVNKSRSQNKDNRIAAITPDINMGRIIFNEDDTDAIEQIKEFAGTAYTAHDDMIDALADAVENIDNYVKKPTVKFISWDSM